MFKKGNNNLLDKHKENLDVVFMSQISKKLKLGTLLDVFCWNVIVPEQLKNAFKPLSINGTI